MRELHTEELAQVAGGTEGYWVLIGIDDFKRYELPPYILELDDAQLEV